MNDPREEQPRAAAASVRLHRIVAGAPDAPLVLVLHGITESRRYWLPRILSLADRYRLIIPDLPGFGLSPKPFADYTYEFFVDSVLGLVEREGAGEARLRIIGHSLGALLGLEIAARHPARVERLALMNLPRFNDPEEAHAAWFAGSYSYRRLLSANTLAANVAQVRRTGVRLTARYLRRLPWSVVADCRQFTFRSLTSTLENCLLHYNVDELLRSVPRLPILIVHGDSDQVAPLDRIVDLPARHPHPVLHVIRGSGHHPFHTHSALCLRILEAHLDGGAVEALDGKSTFVVRPPDGAGSPS